MDGQKSRGEILMDGYRAMREMANIAKEAGITREILTLRNIAIAGVVVSVSYVVYRKFRHEQVEVIQ